MKMKAKEFFKRAVRSATIATMLAMMCTVASAAVNDPPPDVDTSVMDTMVTIVFWVVRGIVLIGGSIAGIPKVSKGLNDGDGRERNDGLIILGGMGLLFGITFAIQALF